MLNLLEKSKINYALEFSTTPEGCLPCFNELYAIYFSNGIKRIPENIPQPLGLLIQATQEVADITRENLHELCKLMFPVEFQKKDVVFKIGDDSDALYLVESGALKAIKNHEPCDSQSQSTYSSSYTESILPGTFIGEISCLMKRKRISTVTVESDTALLWKLPRESIDKLAQDQTRKFLIGFNRDPRAIVETVIIPEPKRSTLCVSSQIGCSLNCS